jgi:Flp pilus assembly pilin Flp
MAQRVRRFLHVAAVRFVSQGGAVSAEYGILLSLIALVIVIALTAFGIAVAGLFTRGNAFP